VTYVDLRPDDTRFVWLDVAGDWVLAELQAFRESGGVWQGWVRYAPEDLQRIEWVDQERIRRGVWVDSQGCFRACRLGSSRPLSTHQKPDTSEDTRLTAMCVSERAERQKRMVAPLVRASDCGWLRQGRDWALGSRCAARRPAPGSSTCSPPWSYFTSERRRKSSPMTSGSTIQMAVVEPSMVHSLAVSVPPSNSAT
jgi:hypothetical protein